MKICAKLGIPFFRYIGDSVGISDAAIPSLPDLVRQTATA